MKYKDNEGSIVTAEKFNPVKPHKDITIGVWSDGPFEGKKKATIDIDYETKLISKESYLVINKSNKIVAVFKNLDALEDRYTRVT